MYVREYSHLENLRSPKEARFATGLCPLKIVRDFIQFWSKRPYATTPRLNKSEFDKGKIYEPVKNINESRFCVTIIQISHTNAFQFKPGDKSLTLTRNIVNSISHY